MPKMFIDTQVERFIMRRLLSIDDAGKGKVVCTVLLYQRLMGRDTNLISCTRLKVSAPETYQVLRVRSLVDVIREYHRGASSN
jgi:hypothetical protein